MIKKLRRRFILAAMLAILLVLETMIGVICGVNYSRMRSQADSLTKIIADSGGQLMPTEPGEDAELGEDVEPDGDLQTLPEKEETVSGTGSDVESDLEENIDSDEVSVGNTVEDARNSNANSGLTTTEDTENSDENSNQTTIEKTDDSTTMEDGETPPDAPAGDDGKLFLNQNKNLFTEETPYETRYFTVTVDTEGAVVSSDLQMVASVTEDEAEEYALEVLDSQKTMGFYENYRYRVVETDDGNSMLIFLDCRQEIATVRTFVLTSFGVSTLGLVAVFVLVVLFSKVVFRPVAESYKKQRQFITDASHELKTPLTIIDANTEVIEMESGESAWTKSIRKQVKRLSTMTQQLITLSKMDEAEGFSEKAEFSLSDAAAECVQTFEVAALQQEKTFDLQLEEGIPYVGNEKSLRQMMDILFENAVKYSLSGTTIRVSLARRNGKIVLETENETEEIPQGDLKQIFERFYRLDTARNSEKGGSGIGLSVAQAIVQAHKGKISAYSADGKNLMITVIL